MIKLLLIKTLLWPYRRPLSYTRLLVTYSDIPLGHWNVAPWVITHVPCDQSPLLKSTAMQKVSASETLHREVTFSTNKSWSKVDFPPNYRDSLLKVMMYIIHPNWVFHEFSAQSGGCVLYKTVFYIWLIMVALNQCNMQDLEWDLFNNRVISLKT